MLCAGDECAPVRLPRQVGYVPETVWKEEIQTENGADELNSGVLRGKHLQPSLAQLKSQARTR